MSAGRIEVPPLTPARARAIAANIRYVKGLALGEKRAQRGFPTVKAFLDSELASADDLGVSMYVTRWRFRVVILEAIAAGARLLEDEPGDIGWGRLIQPRWIRLAPAKSQEPNA